jgi:hypothetical protein
MPTGSLRDNDSLRELFAEPSAMMLYAWKNVVISVWLGDAPVELMRRLRPVFTTHLREVGQVSIISLVTVVGDLPDEPRRRAYRELITAHGASFASVAMVLEREGFIGSAIRGLMTGLLMITGRQQILHVVSNVEQAAAWLPAKHAAATGVVLEPTEIVRVVKEARARAMARAAGA